MKQLLTTAVQVVASALLGLAAIYTLALIVRLAVEAARLGWHVIP